MSYNKILKMAKQFEKYAQATTTPAAPSIEAVKNVLKTRLGADNVKEVTEETQPNGFKNINVTVEIKDAKNSKQSAVAVEKFLLTYFSLGKFPPSNDFTFQVTVNDKH